MSTEEPVADNWTSPSSKKNNRSTHRRESNRESRASRRNSKGAWADDDTPRTGLQGVQDEIKSFELSDSEKEFEIEHVKAHTSMGEGRRGTAEPGAENPAVPNSDDNTSASSRRGRERAKRDENTDQDEGDRARRRSSHRRNSLRESPKGNSGGSSHEQDEWNNDRPPRRRSSRVSLDEEDAPRERRGSRRRGSGRPRYESEEEDEPESRREREKERDGDSQRSSRRHEGDDGDERERVEDDEEVRTARRGEKDKEEMRSRRSSRRSSRNDAVREGDLDGALTPNSKTRRLSRRRSSTHSEDPRINALISNENNEREHDRSPRGDDENGREKARKGASSPSSNSASVTRSPTVSNSSTASTNNVFTSEGSLPLPLSGRDSDDKPQSGRQRNSPSSASTASSPSTSSNALITPVNPKSPKNSGSYSSSSWMWKGEIFVASPPVPVVPQMTQCLITRNRDGMNKLYPQYNLYWQGEDKLLLTAQKQAKNRTSNYHIFDMSKGVPGSRLSKKNSNFLGKLRSNYEHTENVMYQSAGPVKQELGSVIFFKPTLVDQVKEGSQPRKIIVVLPELDENHVPVSHKCFDPERSLTSRYHNEDTKNLVTLTSKEPTYDKGSYRLNFHGRVKLASVKNFQLVDSRSPDRIVVQFGKISEDQFHLDFQAPVTAYQAFCMALSQFNF